MSAFPQVFSSPQAMQDFAAVWVGTLPADTTLALHGDLGTGKTTFAAGLARGLQIADPVTSPSFNIYSLYENGTRQLIHMDAYRLAGTAAFDGLMLEEFIKTPYLWVVEWPEKIADALPPQSIHLYFSITPNGEHRIDIRQ